MVADFIMFGFYVLGVVLLIPAVIIAFLGIRFQAKETVFVAMVPLFFSIVCFLIGESFIKIDFY